MAQTNSNKQSQYWCFTLNNYTDDDEEIIQAFAADESKCQYLVYGREVGDLGTPHLQGYLELKGRGTRMGTVKGYLHDAGSRMHLEPRKGKGWQAADYCKKDGDVYEAGTPPAPPKANDAKKRWREVLNCCIAGEWSKVMEDEPYMWLMNEKKLRSHYQCKKMIDVLDNEWIYGPTGTGKSRQARARYPDAYIKDASTHWWDGYNGEDVVIIEDLDKYHVKMGYYLKIWGDHYSFPAQIKGGQMMARPTKIIVTSNYAPNEIWQDSTTVGPIERRFNVIHMDQPYQPAGQATINTIEEGRRNFWPELGEVFDWDIDMNPPESPDSTPNEADFTFDPECSRAADILLSLSQ